jgi:hypothetical protein
MKRTTSALIAVLCPALLLAGEPTFVLVDGEYFYSETGDGIGVPIEDAFNVIVIGDPGPPPDDDDDDPPPDDDDPSNLREQVSAWASDVDEPFDALILAGMYGTLSTKIGDGTIDSTPTAVNEAMNAAYELLYDNDIRTIDEDDWDDFDQKVTLALGAMVGVDGEASIDEWVTFFTDVSDGLEDSTSDNAIPTWLQPIIDAIIALILQLLLGLF